MKLTSHLPGALFGTASRFAALFPEALIITPHRLHA
jgi:hypothetical protein